ncbi:PQQ-binding-like beta-propeller repeat protein [Corallococcus sp. M34]|nr:PQQ-binding-like beta-propeller repeat protein [Citreicoccus inhibens]
MRPAMHALNARFTALLALVLVPASALALSWTATAITAPNESSPRVVMDEVSELVIDVTNTTPAQVNQRLSEVSFVLPKDYMVISAAPDPSNPDWRITDLDNTTRRIAFQSTISCSGSTYGLPRLGKARFILNVVAPSANRDTANERFVTSAGTTVARDHCQSMTAVTPATNASWLRVGLVANVTVLPRAMAMSDTAAVRVVVENRTTQSQPNITLVGPTASGNVSFQIVGTQPSPFQVTLPQRGAGILVANVQSSSAGTAVAQVRAADFPSSPADSSLLAESLLLDVGNFGAAMDIDTLQAFTGEEVQVRLTVSNPSTSNTYLNVVPRTPLRTGTASTSLVSGPVPASTPRLAPGASAQFVWRYQVSGTPGSSYVFQAQADGTLNGSAVTTDQVPAATGRVVEQRVRITPDAVSASSTNRPLVYTVQNRGSQPIYEVKLLRPATNFFGVLSSGTPPAGWSLTGNDASGYTWASTQGIPTGGEASFAVTYSSFGAVGADTAFRHRLQLNQGDNDPRIRIEAPVTLLTTATASDVQQLTATARDGSVALTWDNPPAHSGVVVLRAEGTAPTTAPTPGLRYAAGDTVGNARVVYSDAFSVASAFTDSSVTNGTTYVYRVFNAEDSRRYGSGNQPTSAGLIATPVARGAGAPLWCYSVGLDARLQPITELGVGIFSSFNDSVVASNTNTVNPSVDGGERWRPVKLSGLVGSRFPVVPLHGLTGQFILVGDQSGVPSAIRATSGEVLWRGANVGTVQSFPVTQLYDYADAAYRAANPDRDLVFFATRLSNVGQNQVVALNAATGAVVWTYRPGDMGMVSGGMLVDYTSNRLYVGSKTAAGATNTLRVLNTLTGAEVGRRALGDIEFGVVRNAASGHILVTSSDGTVYGIDPVTLAPVWTQVVASRPSVNTPAFTSFVRPQGRGFVASVARNGASVGKVERYDVGTDNVVTRAWSLPIADPSGTFSINQAGVARIYVGSSDGKVHQLEVEGIDSRQVAIGGAQRIGTPTIDHTVSRLHVGSADGRICAYPVPFP